MACCKCEFYQESKGIGHKIIVAARVIRESILKLVPLSLLSFTVYLFIVALVRLSQYVMWFSRF